MKVIALILLAALPVSRCAYAATLQPYDPTPEQSSFYVLADANVALCVVGSTLCGPSQLIHPDPNKQPSTNCGLTLVRPANPPVGAKFECRAIVVLPPVPAATLPAGWSKVGDGNCPAPGCTFDIDTRTDVKLCDIDYLICSSVITVLKSPGVHYLCTIENFKDFPVGIAPHVCIGKPNPLALGNIDLPAYDANWYNNFKRVPVPSTVSTRWSEGIVWKASTGKIYFMFGSYTELALIAAQGLLKDSATLNAWRKQQPVEELTAKEDEFLNATIAAYTLEKGPKYAVLTSSTGTRPYYAANTTNTGVGTKLGNVAVGTACDGTKRLGTTSYFWVPSVNGWGTCALVK